MAAPGIRAEVWAEQDVQLPVAKGPNKIRPINDLWAKGWDESEKPAAEEFNYLLNMLSLWINYISGEQIPELDTRFLAKVNNLSDITDRSIARLNLDVWSKAESDTRYVNVIGDTMTGPLTVPRVEFPNGGTDAAYITTTVGADVTNLDFVVGDNFGTAGSVGVDSMRWRFLPSGAQLFTMMELNAISTTAAQLTIAGNVTASGTVRGGTVTGTQGTFTNLTVSNNISGNVIAGNQINTGNLSATGTVSTGNLNASGTVTGYAVNANGSMTTPYIRVNGESNVNSLIVNNNWALVGGRHVVRAVNGYGADGNGNLSLPMPPAGVTQLRFGTLQSFAERRGSERLWGGVMTTWADYGGSNYWMWLRTLQYYINGSWVTVPYT